MAITLKEDQWIALRTQLETEHPKSVIMIRDKMRRELGLLPRYQTSYDEFGNYVREVHLDFFDDRLKSWFLLKYCDYL